MIKKYIAQLWCWFFGHDKIYPNVNRRIFACARCENGPDDRWNK